MDLNCVTLPTLYSVEGNFLICGIFNAILTVNTVVVNSGVLYVLIVKMKRYNKVSEVLIIILGLSDLLTGIFLQIPYTYLLFLWSVGLQSCPILIYTQCCGFALMLDSVVVISLITYDMFCKITKPFNYKESSLKFFLLFLLIVCTLTDISVVLFVYVLPTSMWILFVTFASIFGLTMFIFMCYAHFKINKEVKQIQENDPHFSQTLNYQMNRKTAKMSQSILIVFALCLLPSCFIILFTSVIGYTIFIERYIRCWVSFVSLHNQLIDPIIYCVRLESVRNEVIRTFFRSNNRVGAVVENT